MLWGQTVTDAEVARINSLSEATRQQEIDACVTSAIEQGEIHAEQAASLRSLLSHYYRRPEAYQRVPGPERLRWRSRPL